MNNLEHTLNFLEKELKESEKAFYNRDDSYNPYYQIGQLTAIVEIAIRALKDELGK